MVGSKVGKTDTFGPNGPTKRWLEHFAKRHKDQIKICTPSYIDRDRVGAASEKVLRKHIDLLKMKLKVRSFNPTTSGA